MYYRTDSGYGINNEVDHNEFYNIDNPLNQTYYFHAGTVGPFQFDHNYVHDFENWDTTSDSYHHDGVHCYTSDGSGIPVHSAGNYYYDNTFIAPSGLGSVFTSFFYIEGGSAPARHRATTRPRTTTCSTTS